MESSPNPSQPGAEGGKPKKSFHRRYPKPKKPQTNELNQNDPHHEHSTVESPTASLKTSEQQHRQNTPSNSTPKGQKPVNTSKPPRRKPQNQEKSNGDTSATAAEQLETLQISKQPKTDKPAQKQRKQTQKGSNVNLYPRSIPQQPRKVPQAAPSSTVPLNPLATDFVPQSIPHSASQSNARKVVKIARSQTATPVQELDLTSKLVHGLTTGTYECSICFNNIRQRDQTWPCTTCFANFHLKCISTWAGKSTNANSTLREGWRCPACNTVEETFPSTYKCFCGKVENPKPVANLVPHSCGNLCMKKRSETCPHECFEPCHPGPCPPCGVIRTVHCFCGREQFTLRCGKGEAVPSCSNVCEKELKCGKHDCEQLCHPPPCQPCDRLDESNCWCGKSSKQIPCGTIESWGCDKQCGFAFDCGHHSCTRKCHLDPHESSTCPLEPSMVKTCPCGKTQQTGRNSCTDPISTCGQACDKVLDCKHECMAKCHIGPCPSCSHQVTVRCRCGSEDVDVKCRDLLRKEINGKIIVEPPTCTKVCRALRSCGKHQCGVRCCPVNPVTSRQKDDPEGFHVCRLICGRPLSCGNHTCPESCHKGKCNDCILSRFEELTCHCGKTVLFPPIPCGTEPPKCHHSCTRSRECGHPVAFHECHSDKESCPPCVVLVEKPCECGKKVFRQPCSRLALGSCSEICNKTLPCGHLCQIACHNHDAFIEKHTKDGIAKVPCNQKCTTIRKPCGHPCFKPCHFGDSCPVDQPCNITIMLSCACGYKNQPGPCGLTCTSTVPKRQLACDGACAIHERNKRFAEALEIERAPEEESHEEIEYTERMLEYTKSHLEWVKEFEGILKAFMKDSKKSAHVLPKARRRHLKFARRYADVGYGLEATIVDADSTSPGLFCSKKPNSGIPNPLISEAIFMEHPIVEEVKETPNHKDSPNVSKSLPFNALLLSGITFGIETRDLEVLLEPFFGTAIPISIQWPERDEAVIMLKDKDAREVESILESKKAGISDKLVRNGWAKSVAFCWVNSKNQVMHEQMKVVSKSRDVKLTAPEKITVGNAFSALDEDFDSESDEEDERDKSEQIG